VRGIADRFHRFYTECRVIDEDDAELTIARLALSSAAMRAIKGVLDLLGVSAPEAMERIADDA
jgi:arginyl-tRNA synthetase